MKNETKEIIKTEYDKHIKLAKFKCDDTLYNARITGFKEFNDNVSKKLISIDIFEKLLKITEDCLDWMELMRSSGDAGNWEWDNEDVEYLNAKSFITECKREYNFDDVNIVEEETILVKLSLILNANKWDELCDMKFLDPYKLSQWDRNEEIKLTLSEFKKLCI